MSRKHDEGVVSRHIEIYEADWEFLQRHFGRESEAKLGVSVAIRKIIRKAVRAYRERLALRAEGAGEERAAHAAHAPRKREPPPGPRGVSLERFFAQAHDGAGESDEMSEAGDSDPNDGALPDDE